MKGQDFGEQSLPDFGLTVKYVFCHGTQRLQTILYLKNDNGNDAEGEKQQLNIMENWMMHRLHSYCMDTNGHSSGCLRTDLQYGKREQPIYMHSFKKERNTST